MIVKLCRSLFTAFLVGGAVSACNAGGGTSLPVNAAGSNVRVATTTPIKHVIFVVQENRSFNNIFMGFPGAKTSRYGYDREGNRIPLHSQTMATGWDIDHSSYAYFNACDGQGTLPGTDCDMDGWNNESASFGHPIANFAYAYAPRSETAPYWAMARQYVLSDRMFPSNLDGSFVAHQYVVAAYASTSVDYPGGAWGCEGGTADTLPTLTQARTYGPNIEACFTNPTIADEADVAGVSWRFYCGTINGDGGLWSSYQADKKIFQHADWRSDVVNPPAKFLSQIAAGTLADVTWITPTYVTSDHAGLNSNLGPAWVASVVNAVGKSKYWDSTAIFIFWDDWGGWYDPVKPLYKDYDGLGFRTPLIVVSPYAKKGVVTHVQYETASVLKYIENLFGLPTMAAADARAAAPGSDVFDYSQTPRTFVTIPGGMPTSYWLKLEESSQMRHKPASYIGDD